MITPADHLMLHDFKRVLFRVCTYIAANAVLANFLPPERLLRCHPRLRCAYNFFIDFVAVGACNWRHRLPSLDLVLRGRRMRRNQRSC